MNLASLLLFAAVVGIVPGKPATVKVKQAFENAHFIDIQNNGRCSATAIGPHALLTATHCEEEGGSDIIVDAAENKGQIVKILQDGNDHSILFIKGMTFAKYAGVVLEGFQLGQKMYGVGNPGVLRYVFHEGYVMTGTIVNAREMYLLDIRVFFGDSGMGLYNDRDQLVAVFTDVGKQEFKGYVMGYGGIYPFKFTPKQLKEARAY